MATVVTDSGAHPIIGTVLSVAVGADGVSQAGVANPVPVSSAGQPFAASATFTPAATSHTAGDSNGTAQEFALAAPTGATIRIVSANLRINSATAEASAWRLHMFSITPPSALADDAPFVLAAGDLASYLGYLDFIQAVDMGDTQFIETTNIQKQLTLAGSSVFGYLVNGTTVTPAAVAHIVSIQAVRA